MFSKKSVSAYEIEFEPKLIHLVCYKTNLVLIYGGSGCLERHGYNRIQIFDAIAGNKLKLLGETSFGESNVIDVTTQNSSIFVVKDNTIFQYSIKKVSDGVKMEITNTYSLCESLTPQYIRCATDYICVAFDNGYIHVWKLSSSETLATNGKLGDPICKIKAHEGPFDDFNFSLDGVLAVSVSNLVHEASLWNCHTGKLLMEVSSRICYKSSHRTPITSELQTKFCRFGRNESHPDVQLLYSLHCPIDRSEVSKTASFLIRWDCKAYKETRIIEIGNEFPSGLAVSLEGRYVAVCTNLASVDVYISFSLMRLYHLNASHAANPAFDLTFLSTAIAEKRGNDLELLSLGKDKMICYHKVSSRQSISIFWPIVIAIGLVALLFKLISDFGL